VTRIVSTAGFFFDWDAGAAPMGMSYARSPSIFGGFVTGAQTPGTANP